MRRDVPEHYRDLLAAVPVSDSWKCRLHALMSGSERHYHGTDHLGLLFDRHVNLAPEAGFDDAADTRSIACAIAFHDCIYDAGRCDNEERSAQMWMEASGDLAADERIWVADTIRATSDHLGHGSRVEPGAAAPDGREALRAWMLDLDLTPFGETPEVFDRNARLLRAEATQMDDASFEGARLRLLQRFADAPVIYRTRAVAERFDAQARANIARHLAAASGRTD